MKYISLLNKFKNKILIKKYSINDNLFLIHKKNKKIKKILFYFPNYEFMHLGDHFFFEPLIKQLVDYDYEIHVLPIKQMEFYFKAFYKILQNYNLDNYDLIISRVEFFDNLKDVNTNLLFIFTSYPYIDKPLCCDIIKKVLNFLGKKIEKLNNCKPSKLPNDITNGYEFDINLTNNKYILFNNYIDSRMFTNKKSKNKKMIDFVKNLKRKYDYKIIHTGSRKDLEKDKKTYPFVDIDLRGKITLQNLFYLVVHPNVVYNVSYDAFQMHLFFIYEKKSFIMFRGRFLKKNKDFIIKYVNPPFEYDKKSDLIEYIK